jgi:hypothetical protein
LAVEVFPFKKMAWRTAEIEAQWEPFRRRIYNAVNFAEYESVKRGLRSCDVYQLDPDKFDWQVNKVFLDELHFLSILRSKQYGGYGHRHYNTDTIDENTFIYGCVCKTLDEAILFHDAGVVDTSTRIKEYPTEGIDHTTTGRLLGYPPCCIDFFNGTWLKDGCLDPMYETAVATKGVEHVGKNHVKVAGHPSLNRLMRYWGFNVVPFFPHSFDCEDAVKFGEWWFKLMLEYDKEASEACMAILNMPMKWSLQNCITYVEHPLFMGSANGYYTDEPRVVEWFPSD